MSKRSTGSGWIERKWPAALAGVAALLLASPAGALQNGLARSPPMGWNSYNKFGGKVTEAQVKAIADAFVSEGLKAAGYQYIVVDYCWAELTRDAADRMVPVPSKFPSGMVALGEYIHSKGLKFGMYQSPTKVTCCGEPGSYQHEEADALQFASWGVDYLKYDWCGVQSGENGHVTKDDVIGRYTTMRDAIAATGRPIVYAMCEKGQGAKVQPATWSEPVGHMWRTGDDIAATWARVLTSFDVVAPLSQYARPGGFNDPDMLEVGNGNLTEAENRAHFSLWSIVAAPLMLGNDPSTMPASVKSILTNAEVIAVDQDPLGRQGQKVVTSGQTEVWSKPMQDGSVAVVLFNRGATSASIAVSWNALGISGSCQVRDLWQHEDKGAFASGYATTVASHDVAMIRVAAPGVSLDAGAPPMDGGDDGEAVSDVTGDDAAVAHGPGTGGKDAPFLANGGGGIDAVGDAIGAAGTTSTVAAVAVDPTNGCACDLGGNANARGGSAGLMLAALSFSTRRRNRRHHRLLGPRCASLHVSLALAFGMAAGLGCSPADDLDQQGNADAAPQAPTVDPTGSAGNARTQDLGGVDGATPFDAAADEPRDARPDEKTPTIPGDGAFPEASVIANGGTGPASFRCVNWAVNGDNFQPVPLRLSGILSRDPIAYDVFRSRATAVLNGFTDLLKANSVRIPINEPTVSTESYWAAYKAIIDVGVAKGMKVVVAFWAKDTGIGKPADVNAWYAMWTTVVSAYNDNPNVYFDIHNEPHGYSSQEWIQQVKDWMARFPQVSKSRIIVAGTGWDDNVANVAGIFPDMLLEVHDYSFNGNHSTSAWGSELIGRLGIGTSRTIVGEWGTGVRNNVDFASGVDADNGKAFMAGFSDAIHDHQMGSCWWPGLWAAPGMTSSWSLLNMDGTEDAFSYSIQNQSALDRIWHSWGLQ
jgi:alpha-galactosidase